MKNDAQKVYLGPTISIFVRHSALCPYRGDGSYRRCNCWKHIRWFQKGPEPGQSHIHAEPTKSRTWAGAERAKRDKEIELDPHHAPPSGVPESGTIKDGIASYLLAKGSENCSPATIRKCRYQLDLFETFMAKRCKFRAHQITKEDLIEFRATWASWGSGLTRQKGQTNLRGFLAWYCPDVQHVKILLDTLKPIKLTREDVHRLEPKPYTEEQVQTLLRQIPITLNSTAKIAHMTAAVHCQVATGLAICDLLQLERADIADGWLRTRRQKTLRPVKQRLDPALLKELLSVAQQRYIFWDGIGPLESLIAMHEDRLRRIMKATGLYIKGNVAHRFRDTAVDFWLGEGWTITDVADALGDTVAVVEKHYKDMASKRQEERVAKLPVRTWKAEENS